jgi:hypothetical protein
MGALIPFPKDSETFADVRGEDRTMRVTRHDESGIVVVSLWAGKLCRASFRLPTSELPRLAALFEAPVEVEEPAESAESSSGSAEFVA